MVDTITGSLAAEPRLALPVTLAARPLSKGLNPNGLALLADGRLLVTLGGINARAVVNGGTIEPLIPAGWCPSPVATSGGDRRIFVVIRKSPAGPNPQCCAPQ